jgi:Uma2 family endonuclease
MASVTEPYLNTRRWRRSEYDRLVELGIFMGERLELLDGLLVVQEPQGSSHAAIVTHIAELLRATFGHGWHVRVHAPIALGDDSEPEPDLAVVGGHARDYLTRHPATAALIVEVADSSLRLDRRVKSGLYARAGLPEYWIVNLADRQLEVYRDPERSPDASYRSVEMLSPAASVTPIAAPGAAILVANLLP